MSPYTWHLPLVLVRSEKFVAQWERNSRHLEVSQSKFSSADPNSLSIKRPKWYRVNSFQKRRACLQAASRKMIIITAFKRLARVTKVYFFSKIMQARAQYSLLAFFIKPLHSFFGKSNYPPSFSTKREHKNVSYQNSWCLIKKDYEMGLKSNDILFGVKNSFWQKRNKKTLLCLFWFFRFLWNSSEKRSNVR